jgi:hypothetical protein
VTNLQLLVGGNYLVVYSEAVLDTRGDLQQCSIYPPTAEQQMYEYVSPAFYPLAEVYVFQLCRRRIFHVLTVMVLMMLLPHCLHFRQLVLLIDRNVRILHG